MSSGVIQALLAALALTVAGTAEAAAPLECSRCGASSYHGYRTDRPRGDPALFADFLRESDEGTGPRAAGGDTVLGATFASADIATLKARAAFTGSLADMPRWRQDDTVSARAFFTDELTFAGPDGLVEVTVNLPFDYVIGALSPGALANVFAAPISIFVGLGRVNDSFGEVNPKTQTRYVDGQVAATQPPVDTGRYFAPSHTWLLGTEAGGSFAHVLSHTFVIPANKAYSIFIALETVTSNTSSTRFADASSTLTIAPFTGNFTSVTSGTFGLLGSNGYAAFAPATGGVPEPASWALMIIGFAAVGLAARRRVVAVA